MERDPPRASRGPTRFLGEKFERAMKPQHSRSSSQANPISNQRHVFVDTSTNKPGVLENAKKDVRR
jgi:hypothetical protein